MTSQTQAASQGTTFLILIQLVSRVLTFASNQVVLRHLSPRVLGVATQLELYSITALYFSREWLRTAIQREPSAADGTDQAGDKTQNFPRDAGTKGAQDDPGSRTQSRDAVASQTVINLSYLALILGMPVTILLGWWYDSWSSETITSMPYFRISVVLVGVSNLVELATEPFFALIQHRMLYKDRARVETMAAVAKSLAVCGTSSWAAWTAREVGVLPFALGFVAYAIALCVGYSWQMVIGSRQSRNFSFLLTKLQQRCAFAKRQRWSSLIIPRSETRYLCQRFSRRLVWIGANVYLQLIVKHLLTQGDSMILAALSSLEDQGMYALASNYGGLVARIFFQPIEESSRNLFAKYLHAPDTDAQKSSGVNKAKSHLADILRAYGILAILAVGIGPSVVPVGLRFLIGARWMSPKVETLLSAYCFYIPFLAFNGITEAFVAAVISPADIRRQAVWMGGFSTCFAAVSFVFLRVLEWGAVGLVLANIANMAVRTVWSWVYIKRYLRQQGSDLSLAEVSPGLQTIGLSILAVSVTAVAPRNTGRNIYEISQSLSLSAAFALAV